MKLFVPSYSTEDIKQELLYDWETTRDAAKVFSIKEEESFKNWAIAKIADIAYKIIENKKNCVEKYRKNHYE